MSHRGWDNRRYQNSNRYNPFSEMQRNSTYYSERHYPDYYGSHVPSHGYYRQVEKRKISQSYPRRNELLPSRTNGNSPNDKKVSQKDRDDSDKTETGSCETTSNVDLDQNRQTESISVSAQITFSVAGNVLSIEDAVKLSNSSNKRRNSACDDGLPEKKSKIDNASDSSDKKDGTSLNNSHMTKLQTYDTDLATMKSQIKSQLKIVRELKERFDRENDILKEMKIKKSSLLRRVKKICKALVEEDKDDDDNNDADIVVGAPNEIIDLESSSSDSMPPPAATEGAANSSSEDSDDSDSSGGVEFITKTQPTATTTTPSLATMQPATTLKLQTPLVTSTPLVTVKTGIKSDPSRSHSSPIKSAPRCVTADTLASPPTSIRNSAMGTGPSATDDPIPTKTELRKGPQDIPFVLTVPNGEFDIQDAKKMKADADNGLFNAIEPKLSTIVVSDIDKTFVTDIKIFNNRLFVSASHGLLKQYDLRQHECLMNYLGHNEMIHCILVTAHPVGVKRLLSGGFDQNLLIHNVDTGVVLHKIETDRPILSMCDLMENVYVGNGGGSIMIFSLEKDCKMNNFQASPSGISCLSATKEANRSLLFVGSNDGEYCIWDAITFVKMKVITPLAHIETPIGFVMLQKQRVLAFTKNHVHFIYYAKPRNPTSLNHFSSINSMCLTKNYAIVGGNTGNISVYRLKGSVILKNPIKSLDNSASPIISLTFYNNTIITGNKNGRIYFNRLVES